MISAIRPPRMPIGCSSFSATSIRCVSGSNREADAEEGSVIITRRSLLQTSLVLIAAVRVHAAAVVSTLAGTGTPGFSDHEVNNPYGIIFGPDGGLYFCDLDNQRIRRLDLGTSRITTIAGNGQKGYGGDAAPATAASRNMAHEIQFDALRNMYIAERDNHGV